LFFRNFYDILPFFKDNYNRIDENALRWLKPGIMQLFFSVPMLAIGYYFDQSNLLKGTVIWTVRRQGLEPIRRVFVYILFSVTHFL
jgi:hypothetical protein